LGESAGLGKMTIHRNRAIVAIIFLKTIPEIDHGLHEREKRFFCILVHVLYYWPVTSERSPQLHENPEMNLCLYYSFIYELLREVAELLFPSSDKLGLVDVDTCRSAYYTAQFS
jgi:hypothetical protein